MGEILRLDIEGKNPQPEEPKIILSLTFPKFYAALAGVGALVFGAFTLGVRYQTRAGELKVEQIKVELARANATVGDLRKVCPVRRLKGDLIALRSRVWKKQREAAKFPFNREAQDELKDAEKQLALLLEDNVNRKPDENGTPIMIVVLDDEDPKDTKVTLRGEPETYDIPRGAKKQTKSITWHGAHTTPLQNAASVFAEQSDRDDSPESFEDVTRPSMPPAKRGPSFEARPAVTPEFIQYYPATARPQP